MALTKEERIIRLRRGIASPETSDSLKAMMQAELDELLKPETEKTPPPVSEDKKKKAAPKKTTAKRPAKAKVESQPPVEEVKAHVPPVLTDADKARLKEEYARKSAKKREKQED